MDRQLKPHQLILYGLPGLPLAMLGLPLFVYLPSYYSENTGLSLAAVGLALLVARSLDVVTDPLIGFLNDRFPSHPGYGWRRKSFILAGLPLLIIGLNFLLKPDNNVSAFYLFAWSFVTYLGWTLVNIPWLAWGAEISPDYHEKSVLASSREIFAVIGTVIVISFPVLLSIQSDLQQTLVLIANMLTVLLPLTVVLLLWKVSDKASSKKASSKVSAEPFTDDHTGITANRSKPLKLLLEVPLKESGKLLLGAISHPAIKKLLPAYFINSVANALPATLFILFVTHVLKIPDQVGILLMCYFLSAIAGLPLWLYLARKTDKHISWSMALAVSIGSFIWVPLLGPGDFNAFLIICLVSGFALGADVVLPASIQADISQDISTNQQGENSGGLLFGLWGLLTKLALALAIGIAFPILDAVGFNAVEPTELSTSTLIIMYALVPVTLKFWVVFQMWKYPFRQGFFTDPDDIKSFGIANSGNRELILVDKQEHKQKGIQNESHNSATIAGTVPVNSTYERL